MNWTHKPMFFELPYWSLLKLRHNLDVMHVEKNVFDTLVGTILDIEGKTKDTIKARLDLERMGIRRGLWMNRDNDKARRDLAFFCMKPNDKKEFLKFVSSVKFPDGYASNIARCVNVDGGKFTGLKSHDCHVFMQRLLPVGIRHLLPEDVVKPIILLSRFFSQSTAKTLRKTDMFQLRHDIVQVLCKFEMIFPPAFFTSMIHVMVHLPEEALLAGPVNYRWMYPIERLLGELKKSVRNRAKPEGSIVEAWIQYESLTFCGMYLKDVETVFNRPQRNHDGGMRNEKLSVFAQSARPFGDPGRGELFSRNDMEVAHWFILNNCDEIMGYLYEHEEMMKREHPSHLVAQKHPKRNTRGPCRQLKTTKVTRVTNSRISIAYDERHRAAPTAELHSSLAHDIGHVVRTHCPMQWKSWKVIPNEIKLQVHGQLSTNYHLEDLTEESMAYVNRLFGERYKQWKSDLHHHFQAFDDPEVALQEGCPKELEGREDSWAWLCAHFQAPDYVNKAQVNKGNRKKKTLLHHSGSRPFSYRMDARRRGGSKFPEIDVFGDVYVRPGNELAESLHTTMVERSRLVLQSPPPAFLPPETPIESVDPPQDAGFQILTETLDQTLGRRLGTYCRGMGNARQREPRPRPAAQSSQVTTLTAEVATLRSQMSVILESLARSGIPVPQFDTATSEPVRPEHPQQTTAPAQTSEPHVPEDNVDFSTLFD
ncbi:unnamed protein product [Prunus brigantina]